MPTDQRQKPTASELVRVVRFLCSAGQPMERSADRHVMPTACQTAVTATTADGAALGGPARERHGTIRPPHHGVPASSKRLSRPHASG